MEAAKAPNARVPTDRYKRQLEKAAAKAELVRLYTGDSFGSGNTLRAKKAFIAEYNRPGGKYSNLYQRIGPTSFQTLERWRLKLERSHGRPSCLIDSRGMRSGPNRKAVRRTVSRLLGLIARVPARSRTKWLSFLEGMKKGQSPEEIARDVVVNISTIRKWIRDLSMQ